MQNKEIVIENVSFDKAFRVMETKKYTFEDGKTYEIENYKCESSNGSNCTLTLVLGREITEEKNDNKIR